MKRLETWHGAALVTFAAAVPVGEGLAFGGIALVALLLVLRRHQADWSVLTRGTTRTVLCALGVWLAAGVVMIGLGGEGWLKPSEIAIWSPWLVVPVLVVSATCLDRKWLHRAVVAFMIALLVACVFGLIQYVFNVRPGETISRVAKTVASQGRIPGQFHLSVAGGFFFHRLKMAHLLLIGVGLLTARQLFMSLTPRRRAVEVALLGLTGTTLLLTFARGALLATGVAVAACVLFASRRWRLAAFGGVLMASIIVAGVPAVRERVVSMASQGTSSVRGLIWSQGVRVLADHPLGTGLTNYPRVIGRYYDLVDPDFDIRTYPHSVVMASWVESGPVGMVAYTWAWVAFFLCCVDVLRRRCGGAESVAAATGLFAVVALWVVGLTHDVLFHKPVALAFTAAVGLVIAWSDRPEPTES